MAKPCSHRSRCSRVLIAHASPGFTGFCPTPSDVEGSPVVVPAVAQPPISATIASEVTIQPFDLCIDVVSGYLACAAVAAALTRGLRCRFDYERDSLATADTGTAKSIAL